MVECGTLFKYTIEKESSFSSGYQDSSDVSDGILEVASGISHRKSLTTISLKQ